MPYKSKVKIINIDMVVSITASGYLSKRTIGSGRGGRNSASREESASDAFRFFLLPLSSTLRLCLKYQCKRINDPVAVASAAVTIIEADCHLNPLNSRLIALFSTFSHKIMLENIINAVLVAAVSVYRSLNKVITTAVSSL